MPVSGRDYKIALDFLTLGINLEGNSLGPVWTGGMFPAANKSFDVHKET